MQGRVDIFLSFMRLSWKQTSSSFPCLWKSSLLISFPSECSIDAFTAGSQKVQFHCFSLYSVCVRGRDCHCVSHRAVLLSPPFTSYAPTNSNWPQIRSTCNSCSVCLHLCVLHLNSQRENKASGCAAPRDNVLPKTPNTFKNVNKIEHIVLNRKQQQAFAVFQSVIGLLF